MKRVVILMIMILSLFSCSDSTKYGDLNIYFNHAEDAKTALIPGSDNREYVLEFNNEEIDLDKPFYIFESVPFGTYDLVCNAYDEDGRNSGKIEKEIIIDKASVNVNLCLLYIELEFTQEYPWVTEDGIASGDLMPDDPTKYGYKNVGFRIKYYENVAEVEFIDLTIAEDTITSKIECECRYGTSDFLDGCTYELEMIWQNVGGGDTEDSIFTGTVDGDTWTTTLTSNDLGYNIKHEDRTTGVPDDDDYYFIGFKSITWTMPDSHVLIDWTNALY